MYSKLENFLNKDIVKKYRNEFEKSINFYKRENYNIIKQIRINKKKNSLKIDDIIKKHEHIIKECKNLNSGTIIYQEIDSGKLIHGSIKEQYKLMPNAINILNNYTIPSPPSTFKYVDTNIIKLYNDDSIIAKYILYKSPSFDISCQNINYTS